MLWLEATHISETSNVATVPGQALHERRYERILHIESAAGDMRMTTPPGSLQDNGTIVACEVPGLYHAYRHRPAGGGAAQNRCSSRDGGT